MYEHNDTIVIPKYKSIITGIKVFKVTNLIKNYSNIFEETSINKNTGIKVEKKLWLNSTDHVIVTFFGSLKICFIMQHMKNFFPSYEENYWSPQFKLYYEILCNAPLFFDKTGFSTLYFIT